jgi:hypothetical protein
MAVIKLGGGTIQVKYLTTLTNEDNKVIKKNVKGICIIHLSDIKIVDNFFTEKGGIDNTKCRVFHEDIGWMVLQESYDELVHLKMDGTMQVVGFRQKNYGKIPVPRKTKQVRKTNKTKYVKSRSSKRGNPRKNA